MLQPPCNCKPSNVNNLAPAKGYVPLYVGPGLGDFKIRPPRVYSLMTSRANVFVKEAPIWSLTTRDSQQQTGMKKILLTGKKTRMKS